MTVIIVALHVCKNLLIM